MSIIISTAQEEKLILGKIGAKFVTSESRRKLYAYRLQQLIANKLMFSNLWKCPKLLIEVTKHTGLTEDKTVKRYLTLLTEQAKQ